MDLATEAGLDLVEVAPIYDIGEITALAGATLMLDFLCSRAADMEPVKTD